VQQTRTNKSASASKFRSESIFAAACLGCGILPLSGLKTPQAEEPVGQPTFPQFVFSVEAANLIRSNKSQT
jgi:hypothetical protein